MYDALNKLGFDSFRCGQEEAIMQILCGKTNVNRPPKYQAEVRSFINLLLLQEETIVPRKTCVGLGKTKLEHS